MGQKAFAVTDAFLRKSALPNFMTNTQLPFGAERKITFHKLHSFFDAQIVIDCDQQMEVVGHHHEIVNGKDTLPMIGAQYVNEESCHAFRLEQAPPSVRS